MQLPQRRPYAGRGWHAVKAAPFPAFFFNVHPGFFRHGRWRVAALPRIERAVVLIGIFSTDCQALSEIVNCSRWLYFFSIMLPMITWQYPLLPGHTWLILTVLRRNGAISPIAKLNRPTVRKLFSNLVILRPNFSKILVELIFSRLARRLMYPRAIIPIYV